MKPVEFKPTDEQIREAFALTSDAIIGDCYQAWKLEHDEDPDDEDYSGDFSLDRDMVSEYLGVHGGPHGEEVLDWCNNLSTSDFESELNAAKVPKCWVP